MGYNSYLTLLSNIIIKGKWIAIATPIVDAAGSKLVNIGLLFADAFGFNSLGCGLVCSLLVPPRAVVGFLMWHSSIVIY